VRSTLNLFVRKKLLRQLVLAEGKVVFDPRRPASPLRRRHDRRDPRHPVDALDVRKVESLSGVQVREYQVVLRGRKRGRRA
jgi:hypothetical protein